MLEVAIVVSLILIVAGMAVIQIVGALPVMQANAALTQLAAQMRLARESAISQRRNFQIFFTAPNKIQLRRLELPGGFTDFPAVQLGSAMQFTLSAGVPDTPDGFGNAAAISFGGTPTLTFLSDGTFVDSTGAPLNGSVFIALPGKAGTARAATVLGSTGRISAYRWSGTQWME